MLLDKKWYKPWTWFQESGYYRTKYKNIEFIKFDELSEELLALIKENFIENGNNAKKYARAVSEQIVQKFAFKFKKIDNILKLKLKELDSIVSSDKMTSELISETEKKITWLNDMTGKVMSILDI